MKYTFETEEEEEAKQLLNAHSSHSALNAIYLLVRNFRKHGAEEAGPEVTDLLDNIADEYREFID
jgi:uncharacterized protein YcbK (DUF882 family)